MEEPKLETRSKADPREDYFARWDKVDWDVMLKDEDEEEREQEEHRLQVEKEKRSSSKLLKQAALVSEKESKLLAAKARVAAIKAKKLDPAMKHLSETEKLKTLAQRKAAADSLVAESATLVQQTALYQEALSLNEKGQALLRDAKSGHVEHQEANSNLEIAFNKIEALAAELPKLDDTHGVEGQQCNENKHHGHSHNHNNNCCSSHHNHGKQTQGLKEGNTETINLQTATHKLRDDIAVAYAHSLIEMGQFVRSVQTLQAVLLRNRNLESAWVERGLAYFCLGSPLLAELHLIQPGVSKSNKKVKDLLNKIRKTIAVEQTMTLAQKVDREITEAFRRIVLQQEMNGVVEQQSNNNDELQIAAVERLLEQGDQLIEELFYYSATCKYLAAAKLLISATNCKPNFSAGMPSKVDHASFVRDEEHSMQSKLVHSVIQLCNCWIKRNTSLRHTVALSSWMLLFTRISKLQRAKLMQTRALALEHLGSFTLALEDLSRVETLIKGNDLEIDQEMVSNSIGRIKFLKRQIGDRNRPIGVKPIGWKNGLMEGTPWHPFRPSESSPLHLPQPNILYISMKLDCVKTTLQLLDPLTCLTDAVTVPLVPCCDEEVAQSETCVVFENLALNGYQTVRFDPKADCTTIENSVVNATLGWVYEYIKSARETRTRVPFAINVVLDTATEHADVVEQVEALMNGICYFSKLTSHTIIALHCESKTPTQNSVLILKNQIRFGQHNIAEPNQNSNKSTGIIPSSELAKIKLDNPYKQCGLLMSGVDVPPTLAGFCDINYDHQGTGRDQSAVFLGRESVRVRCEQGEHFLSVPSPDSPVLIGMYPLLEPELTDYESGEVCRVFQFTQCRQTEQKYLYDITSDPNCDCNLATQVEVNRIRVDMELKWKDEFE